MRREDSISEQLTQLDLIATFRIKETTFAFLQNPRLFRKNRHKKEFIKGGRSKRERT